MADALKCDRCGKYYDGNSKHKTFGRIIGGKLARICTTDTNGRQDKWFDLCDDCIYDLFNFMKGGKVIEVPQQESDD